MPAAAYQIGIDLTSNAEGVVTTLDKVIAALGRVVKAQNDTKISFNDMTASLRGAVRSANGLAEAFARVASQAASAARATARIRVPSGGGLGGGGDAGSGSPAGAGIPQASQPPRLPLLLPPLSSRALAVTGGGGYVPPVGGQQLIAGPGGIPLAGIKPPGGAGGGGGVPLTPFRLPRKPGIPGLGPYGTMVGAYLGAHTVRDAYEQGASADDIIAKMTAMQVQGANGQPTRAFTPAQIDQARNQAMATMRRVPGLGYSQALEVIGSTAGLLGDSKEALALAPQMSFNAQVLSQYGKGDAIKQVEDAVQGGELTGLTGKDGKINVPRLTDFINRLTRTTVAMGGNLDISKYLTGLRQFGTGASAADLDFTTATLPAYMKIMGTAKAGTALASMQQVLMAPVPKTRSNRYQQEQERIGLRDKKGNLVDQEKLQRDPQDYFLTTVLPSLTKAGFTTPAQITAEIQRLFPRQTVDRLASAGIADRALIQKEIDRNLAQQHAGDSPLVTLLATAPGAQFKAFTESFKAFEAIATDAAMAPSIDILKRLTVAFQNMTDYVKGHPNDAKMFAQDVDDIVQALIKAAKVIGVVWNILPAPLKSAAAGAAVGAVVGSVAPGVGTATGAVVGGVLGFGKNVTAVPDLPKGYHHGYLGLGVFRDDPVPSAPSPTPASGNGLIQKSDYIVGEQTSQSQPINITLAIDGRTLAQIISKHQVQMMRPSVRLGMNSPDYRSSPMPAGLRTI